MEADAEMNVRMLEAFDTFNLLNLTERLSNQVHFEKRKPQGTDNLFGLLHAIKNHLLIKFAYQKHWADGDTVRNVEPYVLKEFNNRWVCAIQRLERQQCEEFCP